MAGSGRDMQTIPTIEATTPPTKVILITNSNQNWKETFAPSRDGKYVSVSDSSHCYKRPPNSGRNRAEHKQMQFTVMLSHDDCNDWPVLGIHFVLEIINKSAKNDRHNAQNAEKETNLRARYCQRLSHQSQRFVVPQVMNNTVNFIYTVWAIFIFL